MDKRALWFGLFIGSTIGGCVPQLWHAGVFSMAGILLSSVGGLAGIWVAYRLTR